MSDDVELNGAEGETADRRDPGWPRSWWLLAFAGGALVLALLSVPQKAALGADPFVLRGFVVPILFGGISGVGVAYAVLRYQREYRRRYMQNLEAERNRRHFEKLLSERQKLEALGRLAGGVAHDFNNIVTGVLGYTDLLLVELEPDDPRRSHVEEIQRAGERAADLTKQLLAIGRKQAIRPRPLQPEKAVADTLGLLERVIGEGIDLQVTPHSDPWPICVDPTQFEQVLLNLVLNARDAMQGVGRLVIQFENVELDAATCAICQEEFTGPHFRLSVCDEGEGMDATTRAQIFDPFFTTKDRGRGTGLGLAIVLGAVQQNRGHLQVHSELGRGTSFEVFFPRTDLPVEDAVDRAGGA